MATQQQFQADPWIRREVVTPEMDWLGDEMCRRTGRPRTAAGTVGDRAHLRGSHRSQEFIQKSPLCTSGTYTVQSGLTAEQLRHIAGFDFTPGTVEEMVAQCRRILAAMKAGRLNEVREFYGNVDGDQVVDGWDNVLDRAASSDSSHLWHWHLGIDRRHCADRNLMARIVAIALGDDTTEDDDVSWTEPLKRQNGEYAQAGVLLANGFDRTVALNQATARIEAALARIEGRDLVDEPEIVRGLLAVLTPQAIAEALPSSVARELADELNRRLAN